MPEETAQLTSDEILIKDESGAFKILSGGELRPFEEVGGIKSEVERERPIPPLAGSTMIDTGMEEKMLQPPPPALFKKTASFYFHPEDEEEAARHKVEPGLQRGGQKRYSLDKILIKVIESYKVTLSPELKNRLRTIIYSFLRDSRTLIDTQDILKRPISEAGLNLEQGLAGNLLEFLKEIKEKIHTQSGLVIDEKKEKAESSVKYTAPLGPLARPVSQPRATLPEKAAPAKVKPLRPLAQPPLGPPHDGPATKLEKKPPAAKREMKPGTVKSLPRFQRPAKKGARKIADVKKDYKLVGPVDELAILNLETFRRLGESTFERTKKIINKINLLAEDSIARKSAGIQGWRRSPLYKMYVAIGQASMEHNMSVEQVIKEYMSQGKDIITLEEFEAISDINRKLRF